MIQYLIQHLLIALTISLCCLGVHVTTWRDMILYSPTNAAENAIARLFKKVFSMSDSTSLDLTLFLLKPFYRCLICMSSVWSILFWFFWDFNLGLMILVVCGLNTVLTSLMSNILPDE